MTKMTAGFKSHSEIEHEKEKKKQEFDNRPVPIEWQVEKYEKKVNKEYEAYMEQLEQKVKLEKERKAMKAAGGGGSPSASAEGKPPIFFAPPPPPPGTSSASEDDGLPKLIGNPLESRRM
jgi:hypothetical protein